MLKFQTPTREDLKLAASIKYKQEIEEARKCRIFNPWVRKIGIDKEFLDKQVEEKKNQHEFQQARECQLDEALIHNSKLALQLDKQHKEVQRKINQEIEEFRQTHQRIQDRREYSLYDPELLKKSLPLRIGDNDPRLGLSSAQKFDGEDCNKLQRLKAQKEQFRWWMDKQTKERIAADRIREETEKAHQQAVICRDKRAQELDRMERECQRRLTEATAKFNRALADEQEYRRHCGAIRDEEDKKAEIYNHVTGDFLTEAKEQALSIRGPGKPLASRYKGMTADELKAIRDEQVRQIKDIQNMRINEKKMNQDWDELMNSHTRTAFSYQQELERKKSEFNKKIAGENLELARQQKHRQEYLNREVYKNQPSPIFFEQFNRGTR